VPLSVDALEVEARWRVDLTIGPAKRGLAHLRQPDDLVGHFALRRSWLCGPASRRVC